MSMVGRRQVKGRVNDSAIVKSSGLEQVHLMYLYQIRALTAHELVLLDFSLSVKAATLIFISGRCSAISSAKQGKSGSNYNLVKN